MHAKSITAILFIAAFSTTASAASGEPGASPASHRSAAPAQTIEDIADIHHSPIILQHPTQLASDRESIAELRALRRMGEARERTMRARYQSRNQPYPERFAGD